MPQHTPSDVVRQASTWSILWGVSLIVLGMLAIGSPLLAAIAVNVVIAFYEKVIKVKADVAAYLR